ncbi:MAG TPA: ACT domain-containing protein [Thermoanaerobaculia bacterium]|nr:ACT domain-containing protein [Thermoanaerobaculia bacterium]
MKSLTLALLPDRLAVCRLPPEAPLPTETGGSLWSVTRTRAELSLVLAEDAVRDGWKAERGWRCLEVKGPLDFSLTGILASLATPLAEAGVSLFAVSTYDTDYVLVREESLDRAIRALRDAGHQVETP